MIEFDWDQHNIQHLARHNVTTTEAEQCVANIALGLETQELDGEERLMEVGQTNRGRILLMLSTMRGQRIRFVTAFDAPRRWRIIYQNWRAQLHGTTTRNP